jgi:hypothetical protein
MYADDSTIYASATTDNEVTETLNTEFQPVLEWVASNKLVLNTSKTKSIVFGTNHSLILELPIPDPGELSATTLIGIAQRSNNLTRKYSYS